MSGLPLLFQRCVNVTKCDYVYHHRVVKKLRQNIVGGSDMSG